jgi:hypothetical protein
MVIFQWLSTVVECPDIIRIDNRLPLAIQAGRLTRIDIRNERRNLRRNSTGEGLQTQNKRQIAEEIRHEIVSVSILKRFRNRIMNSQSSPEDQALEIEFRAELNLARRARNRSSAPLETSQGPQVKR